MSQTSMTRTSMSGSLLNVRNLGFLPETVIDVGAALGTFQLYEVFPEARHILLEPIAENEPHLAKLCRKLRRAEYLIAAVTREPGDFQLTIDPNLVHSTAHSSTAHSSAAPSSTTGVNPDAWVRTIPGVTLDQLVEERQLKPPFLIKVDVDGNEAEVLAGATKTLQQTEYVIVEVSLFGQIYDVMDEMRSHGFVAYDMVDLAHRPTDHALWQLDMAFVKASGMFRQDKSYTQQSDPIAQAQFSTHLKAYRDNLIAKIEALPDAEASDQDLVSRDFLWIVCPDWNQPEEVVLQDFTALFKSMMAHPECQQIALFIDGAGVEPEQIDLILSTATMQLAMNEEIDITVNGPEIVLLESLTQAQWDELRPSLAGQIVLPSGDRASAPKTSPQLNLTEFAGHRFITEV